jgi:hypothetical protein
MGGAFSTKKPPAAVKEVKEPGEFSSFSFFLFSSLSYPVSRHRGGAFSTRKRETASISRFRFRLFTDFTLLLGFLLTLLYFA